MRAFASKYGFFLNEFDPYYDYRAANFIVNSFDQSWKAGAGGLPGLLKYFSWVDYSTWFPEGRSVAVTSQDGLQFAGALSYLFFRNVLGLRKLLRRHGRDVLEARQGRHEPRRVLDRARYFHGQ